MNQATIDRAAVIVGQAKELPRISVVAQEILGLLQSDRSSASDVERVLVADATLAARVLKIASSALFCHRNGVSTVSAALTLLGFRTVKSIVLAASMKAYYAQPGLADQLLWHHCIGVALASSELAKLTKAVAPDEALMAGLLHDIGKLVLKTFDASTFAQVLETVYNNGVPPVEAEVDAFGAGHAEVGGLVLAKWSFPDSLREAVALHHVAETSPDEAPKLAHVVCLADNLCHHLGVGTRSPKPDMVLADLPSVGVLGLSEKAVNEFAEAFPALLAEQRSMLE